MKIKTIIIGVIILLVIYVVVVILSSFLKKDEKINKLNSLRFTYSTGYHINAYVIYEISLVDGKYIASIKPTDLPDEDKKEYELSKEDVNTVIKKLNEYKIISWDGFRKTDKHVLDGNSFSMYIIYDGDKTISASGYMVWPNNYRNVRDYLDEKLGGLYK